MALDLLKEQAVKDLAKFGTLHQPSQQPVMTQAVLDPGLQPCKLSQAIEEHLLDLATRDTKTKDLYRRGLLHFQAWLQVSTFADKNPYVHEINSDHVRKWKEQLKAEAVERAKKKRSNNKHEQQKIADDPELAKVEPELKLRTADNYLTGLSTFLAEMQLQHRFPQNSKLPTEGQAFTSKSQRMRSGWKPFNETELAAIFDVTNYSTLTKPHEYWFPLLALLTGARREEIAQLGPEDIRKESNGWIIDINDRDFRSVKTASGVRIIPLHPMLVTLGLLYHLFLAKHGDEIDAEDVAWASRLCRQQLIDARRMLAGSLSDLTRMIEAAERVQAKLVSEGKHVTARDIVRGVHGVKTAAEAKGLLALIQPPPVLRKAA